MQAPHSNKNILILGATSAVAIALIQLLANTWHNCKFYLLARNTDTLNDIKKIIQQNGHHAFLITYDLVQPDDIHFSDINYCMVFTGYLPKTDNETAKTMQVNFNGIKHFIEKLIDTNKQSLEQLIVTGSIAGVRLRKKNRDYGLAKMKLHHLTYELQKKWSNQFITTLVIPGYIKTRMIDHLSTPKILTIQPNTLAIKYLKWMDSKPRKVYSQYQWYIISLILRLIPEFIIKRLNF